MIGHVLARRGHVPTLDPVRGVHIDDVDHLPLDVVAIGTGYVPGHVLDTHRHRRAQFLYGVSGTMRVTTDDGTWTVPPERAVLIPPATAHRVVMNGVSTRSLYLEPGAVPWFPTRPRVVEVAPLVRELACSAVELDPEDDRLHHAALTSLLLHEIRRAAPLPLDLPLPADPALHALCRDFLADPRIDVPPEAWADRLAVSVRTLHRRFVAATGVGPAAWRRRACVLHALPALAEGRPVARVAADLGYASPAAFTTVFHRLLGAPPRAFRPRDHRPS